MTGTVAAQDDTEEADVNVTVSETIAVDIQPANLDYSNAEVGNRNTTSDRGFGAIEVENTGSVHIDQIWLNSSTPSTDPFGSGTAGDYDSGNFLEVRPDTSDGFSGDNTNWNYINRKEYMWSDDSPSGNSDTDVPSFIQTDFSSPYEVGALRRGNETLYFVIDADSGDNTCNEDTDGAELRVGNVSALDDRLGTVDFTSSSEYGYSTYTIGNISDSDYGVAGVDLNWTYDADSDLTYDMVTRCAPGSEQPHVYLNKYNINVAGASDIASGNGEHTQYLLSTSTDSNMLRPGDQWTIETAIDVPEGVAQGTVGAGNLRVLITGDPSASG
jgi:hypothetical protein